MEKVHVCLSDRIRGYNRCRSYVLCRTHGHVYDGSGESHAFRMAFEKAAGLPLEEAHSPKEYGRIWRCLDEVYGNWMMYNLPLLVRKLQDLLPLSENLSLSSEFLGLLDPRMAIWEEGISSKLINTDADGGMLPSDVYIRLVNWYWDLDERRGLVDRNRTVADEFVLVGKRVVDSLTDKDEMFHDLFLPRMRLIDLCIFYWKEMETYLRESPEMIRIWRKVKYEVLPSSIILETR